MWVRAPLFTQIYFFKTTTKTTTRNHLNLSNVKKTSVESFNFFFNNLPNKPLFLKKTTFIYYNLISLQGFSKKIRRNNFVFIINKKKWHYSFSLVKDGKTLFFFSLGVILQHLDIEKKSFRRSKKGFLILLNTFSAVFRKFMKYQPCVLINFFDNKLVFFKNKLNRLPLHNFLFFKVISSSNHKNFKKYRSIKRRLTKKFTKQSP